MCHSIVQFTAFMLTQEKCWVDKIHLIDQLVLLNGPFSFEFIGLYMDLIHGPTTTWNTVHLFDEMSQIETALHLNYSINKLLEQVYTINS